LLEIVKFSLNIMDMNFEEFKAEEMTAEEFKEKLGG